jgi:hypothetical protein
MVSRQYTRFGAVIMVHSVREVRRQLMYRVGLFDTIQYCNITIQRTGPAHLTVTCPTANPFTEMFYERGDKTNAYATVIERTTNYIRTLEAQSR